MRYYLNSGLFLATILIFFLPFMEIRCNDSALGHMTGYDLATKGEFRMNDPSMSEYMQGDEYEAIKKQQKGPDPFTIISLLLLITGGVVQLALKKKREMFAVICASSSVLVLIVMQVIYIYQWNSKMPDTGEMMSYVKFTLHFVFGYWLALSIPVIIASLNTWYIFNDKKEAAITPYDPDLYNEDEAGNSAV